MSKEKHANSCISTHTVWRTFTEGPTSHVRLIANNYPNFVNYTCTVCNNNKNSKKTNRKKNKNKRVSVKHINKINNLHI